MAILLKHTCDYPKYQVISIMCEVRDPLGPTGERKYYRKYRETMHESKKARNHTHL